MKNEKPILFSTPMVKAIITGKKTATRRIIKHQPPEYVHYFDYYNGFFRAYMIPGEPCSAPGSTEPLRIKPRFNIGNILWVRETWCNINKPEFEPEYYYFADTLDDEVYMADEWLWKSPMFMPRVAARLFLRVKNISIERLQEITECQAIDEGVSSYDGWETPEYLKEVAAAKAAGTKPPLGFSPRQRFAHLWDKLNQKKGFDWDTNPWVYAIEFEVLEINRHE
jgi:hypothetical protein